MRVLILLHRWLGVSFCLLFAMWFASGIVMHFVPFPALTEAERFAGLAPLDLAGVKHGPAEAIGASAVSGAERVRIAQRSDGPVYLVSASSAVKALRAGDLSDGAVRSEQLALAIAVDHARLSGLNPSQATFVELATYDQWTVPNGFDIHRPLYRIALNDDAGTDIYVSSTTGEVVLETARRERSWNYAGSVVHWIYPTALRSNWAAWDKTVWTLSLVALIAAVSGAALGTLRIDATRARVVTPYRGWQAWHHILGLVTMTFVLSWIFSGWLSMDHGRIFSRGQFSEAESAIVTGSPAWNAVPLDELRRVAPDTKEVEWFAFDGRIYRRERTGLSTQRLVIADLHADAAWPEREFLDPGELNAVASRLAPACRARAVDSGDDYAPASLMPNAPIFRLVCGEDWFHIDGSSGALLEKLDPSRRAYRWLYSALHTFDVPVLMARPALRTTLIVALCGCGLVFSLTGVIIGWRRLLSCFRPRV
jgi:hypothetical protein